MPHSSDTRGLTAAATAAACRSRQAQVLARKRREYSDLVAEFYAIENSARSEEEIGALRQVGAAGACCVSAMGSAWPHRQLLLQLRASACREAAAVLLLAHHPCVLCAVPVAPGDR